MGLCARSDNMEAQTTVKCICEEDSKVRGSLSKRSAAIDILADGAQENSIPVKFP